MPGLAYARYASCEQKATAGTVVQGDYVTPYNAGDWLVYELGVLSIYSDVVFQSIFTKVVSPGGP